MKDKGEIYLVMGSSGEHSGYEVHPVSCFSSFEEADKCKNDCQSQSKILKEMRKILRSFGYTTFISKNGSELTYSPEFFIIDKLVTTLDEEGSEDTEYEIVTLPVKSNKFEPIEGLMKATEYVSSLLDATSENRFRKGFFSREGKPNHKLRLLRRTRKAI